MSDSKPPNAAPPPEPKPNKSLSSAKSGDVALICRVSDDRKSVDVLRRRGDTLELGTVRPLVPGKPLTGEVVRLKPRKEAPLLCDVEVEWDARNASPAGGRPAQVSTDQYRRGWDAIYKERKKPPSDELN